MEIYIYNSDINIFFLIINLNELLILIIIYFQNF